MSGLRAARHAPSRHAVTGPGRQIRPQLVRAAVLPTLAAGLSGAAAVIFTLQLGGGAGDRDARLWPVLTGCALLVVGALAAALLGAQRGAKAVRDRCEALRRSSVRGRQELRTAADLLERGETPPRPVRGGPTAPLVGGDPAGVDEFWLLSQELRGAREQAHATLVRLAGPATPSDSERKVEVFVNLARRLQSLVHREIALLDELEDTVEDPDLLKELFHVDHLATRIRRHAENLAVLGGAASRRQWTRPIDLSEVLRSSVAEVEQYTRVKVVPPAGGSVRGHAVADVVHLLAELVENATVFSAPDTDVVLRAERVTAGIAVEVEDRGLGMPVEEQHRMNALLADPDQVSVRHLLADGRIGLFVVSALARRHGIAVELKSNIYGGVLAVLVLPQELLGAEAPSAADAAGGSRPTSWGTGEPASAPRLEPVPAPQPWQRAPATPDLPPLAVPAPRSGPPTRAVPAPRPGRNTGNPAPAGPEAAPLPARGTGDTAPAGADPGPEAAPLSAPGEGGPAPAGADPWPQAAPLPKRGTGGPGSSGAVTGPGAEAWAEAASLPAPCAEDPASAGADTASEAAPFAARGTGDPAPAGADPGPEAWAEPAPRAGDPAPAGADPWPQAAPLPARGTESPAPAAAVTGPGAELWPDSASLPAPEAGSRPGPVPGDGLTVWPEAAAAAGTAGHAEDRAALAPLPTRGAGYPASAGAVTGPGADPWAGGSARDVPAPGAADPASATAVTDAVAESWDEAPGRVRPGLVPWGGAGPRDAAAASAEAWAQAESGAPAVPAPRDGTTQGGADSAPALSGPDDGTGSSAEPWTGTPAGSVFEDGAASLQLWAQAASGPWPGSVPGGGAPGTAVPELLPAPGAEDQAPAGAVTGLGAEPWTEAPDGRVPGDVVSSGDAASAELATAVPATGAGDPASAGPGPGAETLDGPVPGDGATPGGAASAEPWAQSGLWSGGGAVATGVRAPGAGDSAPVGVETLDGPGRGDGAAARVRGGDAAGLLPLQRGGEPDAGEERPALPRRRAQQHLAPQLREAPVPRPPATAEQPLHDPGLMAAFQRGFGLAQSENQL
ncbi:ATP-binding protein [Streptomyces sp. NPDC056257]|uniref:ATP-binding protein n=1 Tax=Streptomyces sp. NPDC056257 TaxID=3345765 RepID=UPI0035DE40DE